MNDCGVLRAAAPFNARKNIKGIAMEPKAVRTSAQVLSQQAADHNMPPKSNVPAAPPNNDAAIDAFLLEHARSGGATFIKFTKGKYSSRDGEEIAPGMELVAVYDQIQTGWIKFRGKGKWPK
jgi:hypothetical protein